MAKYDWKQLEREYILGDYKSVSAFLKEKGIKQSGSTKKSTKRLERKKSTKREWKKYQIDRKSNRKRVRERSATNSWFKKHSKWIST